MQNWANHKLQMGTFAKTVAGAASAALAALAVFALAGGLANGPGGETGAPALSRKADASADAGPDRLGAITLAADASAFNVKVVGARFEVRDASGRLLPQDEVVGATFNGADALGRPIQLLVRSVQTDPTDKESEILLYELMAENPQTGEWSNICGPAPDGSTSAFPVEGVSEAISGSRSFTLTCTSGAIGKCVRMGYKPWKMKNGESLRDYHEACVRMMRADYCGDGLGRTRNGTLINLYDRIGIQTPDPEPQAFEAAWGKDGAVCVRKTRIEEIATLADIVAACPQRLKSHTGSACDENRAGKNPQALLFNRS